MFDERIEINLHNAWQDVHQYCRENHFDALNKGDDRTRCENSIEDSSIVDECFWRR